MKKNMRIIAMTLAIIMSLSCFAFAVPTVSVNTDQNTGKVTINGTAKANQDINVTIQKDGKIYYIDTVKADINGKYSFFTVLPDGKFDVNVTSNEETTKEKVDVVIVTPPVIPPSTGGSSGGGGGGGAATSPSSNENISNPVMENKTVAGADESQSLVSTVTTEVVANLNSNGRAEATVDNGAVSNALNAAVNAAQDAEKKGAKGVTAEVKLEVKADKNATSVETKLSTSSIGEIAKKQNAVLTLDTPLGTVSFDNTALSMISDNAATGKEISMSLEKISKNEVLKNIPIDKQAQIKAAIGDRTILSLSIKVDGNMNIGNFGKGSVKAGISYNLSQGEKAAGLIVFFIDDNGGMTPMPTVYDPATGQVIFDTNHFSYYAIGYDEVKAAKVESKFTDITSGSWFSEPVTYLVDRGIIKGKKETLFAPGDNITRGEFVTILSRMSGDVMPEAGAKFNDVAKNTWYNQSVLWATEKGIAKGITEKEFAPNTKISRQDMAVMLQNYAKYKKLTLEKKNAITEFADGDKISNYAKLSVSEMQQAGIINGVSKDGITNFYPKNNATRAEAAKMIYEVIK